VVRLSKFAMTARFSPVIDKSDVGLSVLRSALCKESSLDASTFACRLQRVLRVPFSDLCNERDPIC
jgi:hypothetical protein